MQDATQLTYRRTRPSGTATRLPNDGNATDATFLPLGTIVANPRSGFLPAQILGIERGESGMGLRIDQLASRFGNSGGLMRTGNFDLRRSIAIVLALGTVAAADIAIAEENVLDEVVVTARKRTENLQDVTASVSALSPKDLARRFDTDLRSFADAAPNVQIDDLQQGPGSPAAIAIRGIGTTDVEKSFDPAAGVVVDGIFNRRELRRDDQGPRPSVDGNPARPAGHAVRS